MKSGDEMREQFDQWWEDNKHFILATRKVSKGDCFFIWQASRELLRIRNPFELIMGDPDGQWAHEVAEKSLRAQGLKVVG